MVWHTLKHNAQRYFCQRYTGKTNISTKIDDDDEKNSSYFLLFTTSRIWVDRSDFYGMSDDENYMVNILLLRWASPRRQSTMLWPVIIIYDHNSSTDDVTRETEGDVRSFRLIRRKNTKNIQVQTSVCCRWYNNYGWSWISVRYVYIYILFCTSSDDNGSTYYNIVIICNNSNNNNI